MAKLVVYNSVSLDGFFTDANGDMSWAHKKDPQWQAFVAENAAGGARLLFGRVTYELMANFWPTPLAAQVNPVIAKRMNGLQKYVASRTLENAAWSNCTLLKGELTAEVRRLKLQSGPDVVIMGSGSIVVQLADAGLVDEYQIVLNPVILGNGRTLFAAVRNKLPLTLAKTRAFANGNVVLFYEPAA